MEKNSTIYQVLDIKYTMFMCETFNFKENKKFHIKMNKQKRYYKSEQAAPA